MKIALLTLSLICLSSQVLAESSTVEVKKTTIEVKIEEKRMIAGEFEINSRKAAKKTYLDGLRSKLQGSNGLSRF